MLTASAEPRVCCMCPREFWPRSSMHRVCSQRCATKLVKQKQAAEKVQDKAKREKLKTRAKWLSECQAIVNKIARIRDKDKPCVSCDRGPEWDGQWHGSHFRSVGAASAIRLNLWNVHKSCSPCNVHLSGNLLNYRPRLIERIGAGRVEWLEAQNQIVRHDIPYLRRFKEVMGKKLRRLEKRYAMHG